MNYFVKRGDQEYGPYTLAVLQQYVSQGSISKEDLARSEAMSDWVSVASVLGNIAPNAATVPAGFGTTSAMPIERSLPPNLHWSLVVILGIVTIGIFWMVWLFVQAVWVRKVVPKSRALFYLLGYVVAVVIGVMFDKTLIDPIMRLAAIVLSLMGIFAMRSDIEEYAATLSPVGISLSGVMTFFFSAAYFQYHMPEIRELSQRPLLATAAFGQS